MNNSGQQTQEQQEYLYWEVYQAMGNLYGEKALPKSFDDFCQWLDNCVEPKKKDML